MQFNPENYGKLFREVKGLAEKKKKGEKLTEEQEKKLKKSQEWYAKAMASDDPGRYIAAGQSKRSDKGGLKVGGGATTNRGKKAFGDHVVNAPVNPVEGPPVDDGGYAQDMARLNEWGRRQLEANNLQRTQEVVVPTPPTVPPQVEDKKLKEMTSAQTT